MLRRSYVSVVLVVAALALAAGLTVLWSALVDKKREDISGSWYSYVQSPPFKLGIVFAPQDNHPHFLHMYCSKRPGEHYPSTRMHVELGSPLVAELIGKNRYVIMRVQVGDKSVDHIMQAAELNEASSLETGLWDATFGVSAELMPVLAQPQRALLHVGFSASDGSFDTRMTYRLPDENRRNATKPFAEACFPGVTVQ